VPTKAKKKTTKKKPVVVTPKEVKKWAQNPLFLGLIATVMTLAIIVIIRFIGQLFSFAPSVLVYMPVGSIITAVALEHMLFTISKKEVERKLRFQIFGYYGIILTLVICLMYIFESGFSSNFLVFFPIFFGWALINAVIAFIISGWRIMQTLK